eukprot:1022069-Amphidinium_carterae.3
MRADEELSKRVLEAERRVLRAAGVQAAEERRATAYPGGSKAEEEVDAVMGDDVRAIDDAEALRVWSELSELDPNLRGDAYVSEDGGQWHFSDLVDDLRVMKRKKRKKEEEKREGRASGAGLLVAPEGAQRGEREEEVPMEVSTGIGPRVFRMRSGCDTTTRKRAAEAEADDWERTAREESAVGETGETEGKHGRVMLALSLLLAGGATVLHGSSQPEVLEEFLDGRGCVYLTALDTAITVEEPEVQLEWNRPRAECFYDEYTGIELPREGVIHAHHEENQEMACMQHLGVWEKPYGVRWVDSDKRPDPETPDLRSRLVVLRTRGNSSMAAGDVMSTFAATPPLETLRLLCFLCMSAAESDDFVIQVWDRSRAHQHCKLKRKVFIRLPEEDPRSEEEGDCGLLVTALNGVRDAAQSFEHTIGETMTQTGFMQGAFSPCHSREHKVGVMHHGDDFVAVGPRRATPKVGEALSTVFIVKDRGVLGPRPGDLKHIRVLNRTLVWKEFPTASPIEHTADKRHVTLLQAQLGLTTSSSKPLSSPGAS